MAIVSRLTTWITNQILTSAALNSEFSNITNLLNNIDAGTTPFTVLNATTGTFTNLTVTNLTSGMSKYRRPCLLYSSATVALMETGLTGTSGQAQIMFPDGSVRTDSTALRINFDITRNALLTGTAQSGLRTALSEATNTWYAMYAVKSQVNTTDIVLVGDTLLPLQANYATLNTNFGSNGWVYLGLIRNGDNSGATGDILSFWQSGNLTIFNNACAGGHGQSMSGLLLATSASATSLTYTYAAGTGTTQLPDNIIHAQYEADRGTTAANFSISNAASTIDRVRINTAPAGIGLIVWSTAREGLTVASGGAIGMTIGLCAFNDIVLGIGSNPLL